MSRLISKRIDELAFFNPSEKVVEGQTLKKIPMENLNVWSRKITGFVLGEYKSGSKFRNNDVLVAKITPCLENGKTAYVDILDENEVAFGSTEFIVLRPKEGINSNFLYYLAISPTFRKRAISCMEGTSGRKRVNESTLKLYDILLPQEKQQKKIANVLLALDKKIELNNRINAELESMAKTLYDYWFVQFDFPNEEGKPYKSSGGKMVYNTTLKREIPEGWEDSTLISIENNIVTGKTPSKEKIEYFNGSVPFITIGDIRSNTFIINTEETLSEIGAETQKNKYLPEGAICVSCIASPGLVGFVGVKSQTNQQINSIICSKKHNQYFLYFSIKQYFKGTKAKTGNTFANMNKKDFSDINLVKPPEALLGIYYARVTSIFESIKNRYFESNQLQSIRDFLLPMLMNGQVTVK